MLGPTIEQSKAATSIVVEAIPQASFDPSSTSEAMIVAFPDASN